MARRHGNAIGKRARNGYTTDMRPGLHLTVSNRMETLAERAAAFVRATQENPFVQVPLVVPSLGLARWLNLQLAHHNGIVMGVAMPFPRNALERWSAQLSGWPEDSLWWDKHALQWAVRDTISAWSKLENPHPEISPLTSLEAEKHFAFARQIATVFDRYLLYRTDWLINWENSRNLNHWQALLWAEINRHTTRRHLAQVDLNSVADVSLSGMPAAIGVFAPSSLPPLYLHLLEQIAIHRPVHLFLLRPSPSYWGDLLEDRLNPNKSIHPLLTAWGQQAAEFTDALTDAPIETEDESGFAPPHASSLLHRVQLSLYDVEIEPTAKSLNSDSIQFLSCRNPTREVEALHEVLSRALAEDPTLEPRDILILTPDIDTYGPIVDATFACQTASAAKLPVAVGDLAGTDTDPLTQTIISLLRLTAQPLSPDALRKAIDQSFFSTAMALPGRTLSTIYDLLIEAGFRYGLDEKQLADYGVEEHRPTTLEHAVRRITHQILSVRSPLESPLWTEPTERSLGDNSSLKESYAALVLLLETFKALRETLTIKAWTDRLEDTLSLFRDINPEVDATTFLSILQSVRDLSQEWPSDDGFSPTDMASILADYPSGKGSSTHFLSGRITLAALQPLRAVPARIIALLGVDEERFPREESFVGFDLSRQQHRAGDRDISADDRNLMLETLLAARDKLIITYTGSSPIDGHQLEPSSVVQELQEVCTALSDRPLAELVREYPLHKPMAPTAVNSFIEGREQERREEQSDSLSAVLEWSDVQGFVKHPSRYWRRHTADIGIFQDAEEEPRSEDFIENGLSQWHVRDALLRASSEDGTANQVIRKLLASGDKAPGQQSQQDLEAQFQTTIRLMQTLGDRGRLPATHPLLVDFRLSGNELIRGLLPHATNDGLFRLSASKLSANQQLVIWVDLLLFAASQSTESTVTLYSLDAKKNTIQGLRFRSPNDAEDQLRLWVDLFHKAQEQPVELFPESALVYIDAFLTGDKDAVIKASKAFEGSAYKRGERQDADIGLLIGEKDPWRHDNGQAATLARELIAPMVQRREVIE